MGKKGFFQRKSVLNVSDMEKGSMKQQVDEIGQQVIALRQRLKFAEQEKENIKLQFEALKYGKLQECEAEYEGKIEQLEKKWTDQGIKSEQLISSISQELSEKKEQLASVEAEFQAEKDRTASLSQEFDETLSKKDFKIIQITKEKLEIKSQVTEALLELQEHFEYKTALLETERQLLAQEKEKYESDRLQKIEECENLTRQMEDAAAEKVEQSMQELNRLKDRIDYYSNQINEAAQTIDALLGNITHMVIS